jgi:uncharacterized protein YlxP (DUF503 family)
MTIGLCRVVLYLPECGSLKSKRNLLASIVTRIRSKFNVSVSEIEDNELWQRATLGVAIVSNEARYANRVLSKVVDLVKADVRVELLDHSLEMM